MQISTQKIKKQGIQENLLYTGHAQSVDVNITLITYNEQCYQRTKNVDLAKMASISEMPGVKWLNIDGVHDVDVIESIGMQFGIHFLVLEDIMDVNQRPKIENYDNYIYLTLKMMYIDKTEEKIISEQISMVLFKDILITFQERSGDIFDTIRNKIMTNKGKIRKLGSDYLAYSLIDAIVDHYSIIMEDIGEEISGIEKEILKNPSSEILEDIYNLKMDIIFMRKTMLPIRELITNMRKEESELINDYLEPYARDLYDHIVQVLDNLKSASDTITGILDIYSSSISNQTNKVMQRLTLITTIFMPLSVLAGIGGMSEWSMMTGPGNWRISYPLFFLGLIVIGFITWLILRKVNKRKR